MAPTKTNARVLLFVMALGALAAAFAACFPDYTFGAAAIDASAGDGHAPPGDDASPDGNANADGGVDGAGNDGSIDAADAADSAPPFCPPATLDGSVGVTTIGATALTTGTGLGQPVHLAVASDCTAWYFYPSDDGSHLLSRKTSDYATWTDGEAITLNGSLPSGDDFSVAHVYVGGVDVIHIVADLDLGGGSYITDHFRTTVVGGHLTTPVVTTLPNTTHGDQCLQDAPAVIVSADGHVYDATGWTTHPSTTCDLNIYRSSGTETGAAFSGSFSLAGVYYSIPTYTFAHQLVDLPEAGAIVAAMPDQDNQSLTNYEAIGLAISPWDPNDVASPTELFYPGGAQAAFGDWALCRIKDSDVRAIRHTLNADGGAAHGFQSTTFNGATWQTDTAPAGTDSAVNSGVAVVGDGNPTHAIVVATVGNDGKSINLQKWTGAAWSPLPSLARGTTVQSLAGTGCGATHPAVFWTEGSGTPYAIEIADLSSVVATP